MPILSNAENCIKEYNCRFPHYDIAAKAIYQARSRIKDPFSPGYLPFIVFGLIAFDMARCMGKDIRQRYDPSLGGVATRLRDKLSEIRKSLCEIVNARLDESDIEAHKKNISSSYQCLSRLGNRKQALHADKTKHFHVGATKILHWLAPDMFLIIDRNTAHAFKRYYPIGYRNGTQPGYDDSKYLECLGYAQQEIRDFGYDAIRQIEPDTPLARLFDKVAFVEGQR